MNLSLRVAPLLLAAPVAAQGVYTKAVSLDVNADKLIDVAYLKDDRVVVLAAPGTFMSEKDVGLSGCVDLLGVPDPARAADALIVATTSGIKHVTWSGSQFLSVDLSPAVALWDTVEHMDVVPETGDVVAQLSGGDVRRLVHGAGAFPWLDAGGFFPTTVGSELVVADLDSNGQSELALLTPGGVDVYDLAGGAYASHSFNASTNAMCRVSCAGVDFLAASATVGSWGVLGFIGQAGLVSMSLLPDPQVVGMASGMLSAEGDDLGDLVLTGKADAYIRVLRNVGTAQVPDVDPGGDMILHPFGTSSSAAANEAHPLVFDVDGDGDDDVLCHDGVGGQDLYLHDTIDASLTRPYMITDSGEDAPTLHVQEDALGFSFTAVVPSNALGEVLEVIIYELEEVDDTEATVRYYLDYDLQGDPTQVRDVRLVTTLHSSPGYAGVGNLCGTTPKIWYMILRTASRGPGGAIAERHHAQAYGIENEGTNAAQVHLNGIPGAQSFDLERVCLSQPGTHPGTSGSVGAAIPCVPVGIPPF